MAILSSTNIRAMFNMNVTSKQIDKFEWLDKVKSIRNLSATELSQHESIFRAMSNYKGHNAEKLERIAGYVQARPGNLPEKDESTLPHSKDVKLTMLFDDNTTKNESIGLSQQQDFDVNGVCSPELMMTKSKEMVDDFIFGFTQKKAKPDVLALLNQVKFEQHSKPIFDNLTNDEKDAINFYIGNRIGGSLHDEDKFKGLLFSDVNSYLRGYDVSDDIKSRVTPIVRDMYSGLMKMSSLSQETLSYRAVDAKHVAGFDALDKGSKFFDFAPMSSSENQDFVRGWFKTRMANYPVETPAVFILEGRPANTGVLTNKSEVIYPSGTTFEVTYSDIRNVKLMDGYEREMKIFVVKQSKDNKGTFIDLASGRYETRGDIAQKLASKGL